jgi:hypothetical protein
VKVIPTDDHHADEAGRRSIAYLIDGQRFEAGTPRFADAVAAAHAARHRPRCLCLVEGIEMYVARLAGTDECCVVKRMPGTGSRHAPDCPSYEPPPEASGLGQVLGSAISEDPATGETTLRLDFPLAKIAGRSTAPAACGDSDSVASNGTRLSLRGLLHYLWDQAELTRWHPGFAGKRHWGTVRSHLLRAAEHKLARGDALRSRLYVPEPFSVDERDAIIARRLAQWQHAVAAPGRPQHLMLLIGEVKEIVPARYGYRCVIKHVPDQAFAIDEPLYRRLGRRFDAELTLWGSADSVHMVAIATFGVSEAGIPAIVELSLMPVTPQWLPVEDSFERQLVERLVADGRSFIKGLRYNLRRNQCVATATLTDTGQPGPLLFIVLPGLDGAAEPKGMRELVAHGETPAWTWRPASDGMPQLPAPAGRDRRLCSTAASGPEP